jgi:hypothetical protein
MVVAELFENNRAVMRFGLNGSHVSDLWSFQQIERIIGQISRSFSEFVKKF